MGLATSELESLDASWRAASSPTVSRISLRDESVHLGRLIRAQDASVVSGAGAGRGGPVVLPDECVEGGHGEVHPKLGTDALARRDPWIRAREDTPEVRGSARSAP
jgi:hypothetical protein